jgi:hypothetical protein
MGGRPGLGVTASEATRSIADQSIMAASTTSGWWGLMCFNSG